MVKLSEMLQTNLESAGYVIAPGKAVEIAEIVLETTASFLEWNESFAKRNIDALRDGASSLINPDDSEESAFFPYVIKRTRNEREV